MACPLSRIRPEIVVPGRRVVNEGAALAKSKVGTAIDHYLKHPPQTAYERGYVAALLAVYRDELGGAGDRRIAATERMLQSLTDVARPGGGTV